ncbi:hypothetical protein BKA69DRAFT_688291 [Paraphysoderma sedebokerense]|nr:hypothetical protein BKA69DRAFT_688291 [Paraphysoderma sedebokerense]
MSASAEATYTLLPRRMNCLVTDLPAIPITTGMRRLRQTTATELPSRKRPKRAMATSGGGIQAENSDIGGETSTRDPHEILGNRPNEELAASQTKDRPESQPKDRPVGQASDRPESQAAYRAVGQAAYRAESQANSRPEGSSQRLVQDSQRGIPEEGISQGGTSSEDVPVAQKETALMRALREVDAPQGKKKKRGGEQRLIPGRNRTTKYSRDPSGST